MRGRAASGRGRAVMMQVNGGATIKLHRSHASPLQLERHGVVFTAPAKKAFVPKAQFKKRLSTNEKIAAAKHHLLVLRFAPIRLVCARQVVIIARAHQR